MSGTEEIKGVEEVKAAGRVLREARLPNMSYHGFVEGDDLGKGAVDVFVTEGFTGNIALKTAKGPRNRLANRCATRSRHLIPASASVRPQRLARCAPKWTRALTGAYFSALTALSSRAMAALTPKATPGPWNWRCHMVRQELLGKNSKNDRPRERFPSDDGACVRRPVLNREKPRS